MSDIAPVSGPSFERLEPVPVPRTHQEPGRSAGATDRPSDRVDISDRARLLSRLAAMPEIRQELVDSVRAQIEAGMYETEERLEEAIEALAEELEL
jgi:negative regulator of flagellin synthesis FlgM